MTTVAATLLFAAASAVAAPAAALALLAEENPPFSHTENGKLQGSAVEVVREMVSRAHVQASFEVVRGDKAIVRAQAERDTCVVATPRRENRQRLFTWIGPIATSLWAVYGRTDFTPTIRTVKDLAPYRIGALARDPKAEFLRENGVRDVRALADDSLNPQRLFLARDNPDYIDLWITDLHSSRTVAKAAKVTDIKLVFIASEQPLFLACSPQTDAKSLKALSGALDEMKADGSLQRLAEPEKRTRP